MQQRTDSAPARQDAPAPRFVPADPARFAVTMLGLRSLSQGIEDHLEALLSDFRRDLRAAVYAGQTPEDIDALTTHMVNAAHAAGRLKDELFSAEHAIGSGLDIGRAVLQL